MVKWSDNAKAYPLEEVCKAADMPDFVLEMAVRGYKINAEEEANKKPSKTVEVEDIRKIVADGYLDRYPDKYETLEDAYKRLEDLENKVGYKVPG